MERQYIMTLAVVLELLHYVLRAKKVVGAELSAAAIEDATKNKMMNQIENLTLVCAKAM